MPVILVRSFGFSDRLALILTAVDFISLCFWGLMIFFVIDRIGRKKLMFYGAFGQSICFAVAAIGLGIGTKTTDAVAVAFIFLYHVCFVSLGVPIHPSQDKEKENLADFVIQRDSLSSLFRSCTRPRSTPSACETPAMRSQWSQTGFSYMSSSSLHQLVCSPDPFILLYPQTLQARKDRPFHLLKIDPALTCELLSH